MEDVRDALRRPEDPRQAAGGVLQVDGGAAGDGGEGGEGGEQGDNTDGGAGGVRGGYTLMSCCTGR